MFVCTDRGQHRGPRRLGHAELHEGVWRYTGHTYGPQAQRPRGWQAVTVAAAPGPVVLTCPSCGSRKRLSQATLTRLWQHRDQLGPECDISRLPF